jgi:hypothetical protein
VERQRSARTATKVVRKKGYQNERRRKKSALVVRRNENKYETGHQWILRLPPRTLTLFMAFSGLKITSPSSYSQPFTSSHCLIEFLFISDLSLTLFLPFVSLPLCLKHEPNDERGNFFLRLFVSSFFCVFGRGD